VFGTALLHLFHLHSTFFSQTVSAPRTQFEEKGGVARASKEVFHKFQFFKELLHGRVCGAEFVKQSQTPPQFEKKV